MAESYSPMGAQENRTMFYSIVFGQWSKRVKQGTPGSTMRVNKEGKTVYEMYPTNLQGWIKSFSREQKDNNRGETLVIHMVDFDGEYNIKMDIDSGYSINMMSRLLNNTLSAKERVVLSVYDFKKDDGKKVSGITVYNSAGVKIQSPFSKENDYGKPGWEKISIQPNKVIWNKYPEIEFLYGHLTGKYNVEPIELSAIISKWMVDNKDLIASIQAQGAPAIEQPNQQQPTQGGFGGAPAQNQQRQTQGGFGGAPVQNQQQQTQGGFGGAPAQNQQRPTQGGFGSNNQGFGSNNQSGSGFGAQPSEKFEDDLPF